MSGSETPVAPTSDASKESLLTDEEISTFNEQQLVKLVILAWNLYDFRDAESGALVAINEKSFVMETTSEDSLFSFKEKKKFGHKFTVPIKTKDDFLVYFDALVSKHNVPCVQLGASTVWTWGVAALWIICIIRVIGDESTIYTNPLLYPFYLVLEQTLELFPMKKFAWMTIGILAVSNGLQALHSAYLCNAMGFDSKGLRAWSFATLVSGQPMAGRLIKLNNMRLAKKSK
jgi:hypothetical protein